MMDAVRENLKRLRRAKIPISGSRLCGPLSKQECVFTRLAALLHDIGHLPAGHTLEDELKLIPNHDKIDRLKLVLDRSDWPGSAAPTLRSVIDQQYKKYVTKLGLSPTEVLFQIIAKDPPTSAEIDEKLKGIRIKVCRDIVGNTICADLLDYLHRDWFHIGKPRYYEKRLFQYMEIRENDLGEPQFVISVGGKPKLKTDAVSAILDLLETRYQLAESVLFHRTKCSAAAMLERSIQELRSSLDAPKRKAWTNGLPRKLLDYSDLGVLKTLLAEAEQLKCSAAELPLRSLRTRRLYKTVYTTFYGDRSSTVAKRLEQTYSKHAGAPIASSSTPGARLQIACWIGSDVLPKPWDERQDCRREHSHGRLCREAQGLGCRRQDAGRRAS